MAQDQNLANLYRPKTFGEMVGQELAVTTLKRIAHADGIVARALFLRGSFGSGKCVCFGELVSTDRGYIPIGELCSNAGYGYTPFEIGVEQPDGSYASTSHFYKEASAKVYHLRCKSGRSYSGTADHPRMAYRVGSDRVELVRCGDLRVGDYIARRWTGSIELLPDVAEAKLYCLYGVWLGDGSYNKAGVPSLQYISCDTLADWCRDVEGHFGPKVRVCSNNNCRTYSLPLSYSRLSRFIDGPCVAATKRLHGDVFGSRERAFYTLYGLLITDGYVDKAGRLGFGTVSSYLADGVCDILDYLGLQYSIRKRVGRKYFYVKRQEWRPAQDSYRIMVSAESSKALYDAMVAYVPLLEIDAPHQQRLLDGMCAYLTKYVDGYSVKNNKSCVNLGDAAEAISASLVSVRRLCSDKHKHDSYAIMYRNLRGSHKSSAQAFERMRLWLRDRGHDLPDNLQTFCDVRFDRIESIDTSIEDVYDVVVPSTHLFMSGNVVNHNTCLSRIFAKAMNCSEFKHKGDICNECTGCQEASASNSSLYWELDATRVGNVDGVRALKEQLMVVPEGRRVVTIDEIQSSSKASQDALLKTVEEGVPNTIFMFCGTEDISPTLKSRCVNIDISTIPLPLVETHVAKIAASRGTRLSADELHILAMKSEGHMRNALQLLQFYELAGPRALDSSYFKFRDFIVACFSKSGSVDPSSLLSDLLLYPTIDVRMSVGLLLRNVYATTDESSVEFRLQKAGLGKTLFGFFFSPLAQQALGSEVGVEVLLRSLIERTSSTRSGNK